MGLEDSQDKMATRLRIEVKDVDESIAEARLGGRRPRLPSVYPSPRKANAGHPSLRVGWGAPANDDTDSLRWMVMSPVLWALKFHCSSCCLWLAVTAVISPK